MDTIYGAEMYDTVSVLISIRSVVSGLVRLLVPGLYRILQNLCNKLQGFKSLWKALYCVVYNSEWRYGHYHKCFTIAQNPVYSAYPYS